MINTQTNSRNHERTGGARAQTIRGGLLPVAFLFLVGNDLAGMDGLNFFDLLVEPGETDIRISAKPQILVTFAQLENNDYSFSQFMKHKFDSPIQHVVRMLTEIDANREELFGKNRKGFKDGFYALVTFEFELAVRMISGKAMDRTRYKAEVGLSEEPSTVLVISDKTQHRFDIRMLNTHDGYLGFLTLLAFPEEFVSFKIPDREQFIVDLYFTCTALKDKLKKELRPETQQSFDLLATLKLYNGQTHLGTTHCKRGSEWEFVLSGHLHFYKETIDAYAEILDKRNRGEDIIDDLKAYIAKVPADFKALNLLVNAYMDSGLQDDAYHFISHYKPLFANSPEVLTVLDELEREQEAKRLDLLNQRVHFRRDDAIHLKVTSPAANDYVGGTTRVEFQMENFRSPILQIDCSVNGEVVGSIVEPPFRIPFNVPTNRRALRIKVSAYFENGTYQEAEIPAKTLYLGAEEEVRLITLRVIASRGIDEFLLNLIPTDFLILENKQPREIRKFKKDEAPLRVAILIDTSASMVGEKLYRAQYAVNTFLSKLEPTDSASIYTFDQSVLKLSDFTNRYEHIQPVLLTLSPHHATSLNNALVLAHQDLLKEQGTQVLIVVSDGKDSSSQLTSEQVYKTLKHSKVMVYSIIINLDQGENREGSQFMKKISRLTGSNTMEVEKIEALNKSFNSIYKELKSFYLIDFYSSQQDFLPDSIEVKVLKTGVNTRFKQN